jgi:hypothetical protein
VVLFELFDQFRILDAGRRKWLLPFVGLHLAADRLVADDDLAELVLTELILELAVRNRRGGAAQVEGLCDGQQQDEAQDIPD